MNLKLILIINSPFEEFGADNEFNMRSITDFYIELLKKKKMNFDNITTNEVSDGKYELVIDNNFVLDTRAWDDFNSVIDNVNSIEEYSKKNMNKEYINELFKRKKEKFKDSETEIISSKDLENYILDTITSNFLYDFNIDIDLNKLFEKNIDIEVNNNRIMRITQTESDKVRNGIGLKTLDEKGNVDRNDLISEGDFVMLMNYYSFVKDNDIYDEFININGINKKEDFDINKEMEM